MTSIRARLLVALLALVALASLLAGALTYRRVLAETSTLFDYQLRQMALSLRSQMSLAPRLELPPQQGDADFVVQIWDPFGARIYLSRPGLPLINRAVLGYETLDLGGDSWRVYGLQTVDGVIQIAQPVRVREVLARRAALRVAVPLLLLLPLLGGARRGWCAPACGRCSASPTTCSGGTCTRSRRWSRCRCRRKSAPLIEALNRLLIRLQAAFATQRAFVADAAHELRSPLTAVRLQLQLLDRAPDEAARHQARSELGAAVDRAIHLVEQLLTLARSEPRAVPDDLQLLPLEEPVALRADR